MTTLTKSEKEAIMADMKSFDEPMPAVGIFWYDPQEHDLEKYFALPYFEFRYDEEMQ